MCVAPCRNSYIICTSCLLESVGTEESKKAEVLTKMCFRSEILRNNTFFEVFGNITSSLCRVFLQFISGCLLKISFKNKILLHEKIIFIIIILYELT